MVLKLCSTSGDQRFYGSILLLIAVFCTVESNIPIGKSWTTRNFVVAFRDQNLPLVLTRSSLSFSSVEYFLSSDILFKRVPRDNVRLQSRTSSKRYYSIRLIMVTNQTSHSGGYYILATVMPGLKMIGCIADTTWMRNSVPAGAWGFEQNNYKSTTSRQENSSLSLLMILLF